MDKVTFLRVSLPIMCIGTLLDCITTIIGLSFFPLYEVNPIAAKLFTVNPLLLFIFDIAIMGFILRFFIWIYYEHTLPLEDRSNYWVLVEMIPALVFGGGRILIGLYNLYLILCCL